MLMAACHSKETGWIKVEELERLSDLREESGNLLWAETDVATLSAEEVSLITEEFELPRLAVEDAVEARSRPKLQPYGKVTFVVVHQLDEVEDQLEAVQIAGFVGPNFVLIFHAGAERTIKEAKRRWEEVDLRDEPAMLLHILLDVIVDDYQAIADRVEEEMESLEEIVLEMPNAPVSRQLYALKQRVARLRRYVLPGTRLLDWALDPDTINRPIPKHTEDLFRDVHDHLLRISDQVRNVDDLAQAVIDLTRAEQAAVLNETNRRLAAWAAIFAVGTFVAGIYGMNFSLVPGTGTRFGFWFSLTLMAATSIGLYVYFKRRRWL
ncbi:MAG: magnesium transporter CorA family protein [Actinomycetota bacterium]|nr:magnesium transporter CorA family protein [Actinomycetota bacterium]